MLPYVISLLKISKEKCIPLDSPVPGPTCPLILPLSLIHTLRQMGEKGR